MIFLRDFGILGLLQPNQVATVVQCVLYVLQAYGGTAVADCSFACLASAVPEVGGDAATLDLNSGKSTARTASQPESRASVLRLEDRPVLGTRV